jgi:integrase
MKLKKLLDLYQQEKPQLRPATVDKYQSVIRLFIKDTGIDHIFIDRNECIQWRNKILNRSSTGNCNNYHRHMQSLFNFAVKFGHLESNVFSSIKMLKVTVTNLKHKTNDQETLEKLALMFKTDTYYWKNSWFYLAMIDVLTFTAIRRRQIIGIKWKDIDFKNKTLYLDAEFSKNGTEYLLPLNQKLMDCFLLMKKKSYEGNNDDQVFNITKFVKSYKSKNMTEEHISNLFTKWGKKIEVLISPHRFRHSAATKIANNGCNLKSLQDMLNHKDIRTTMIYVESNIDDLRQIQSVL